VIVTRGLIENYFLRITSRANFLTVDFSDCARYLTYAAGQGGFGREFPLRIAAMPRKKRQFISLCNCSMTLL
jgi:hypothetical protein